MLSLRVKNPRIVGRLSRLKSTTLNGVEVRSRASFLALL